MTKKIKIIQMLLLFTGIIILLMVYVVYPKINDKKLTKLLKESVLENKNNSGDKINETKNDAFLNVEYQGFYQLTNPFVLKAKRAKILSQDNSNLIKMEYLNINITLENESWQIECDSGRYNKSTYDIYCEGNVVATNGETKMTSEYLNLLATEDVASIKRNVVITDKSGSFVKADNVDYNFETKKYKLSMYPGKKNVEIKFVNN